ncbi:hypothetical protein [Thalassolituus oleivorans]|uniref:hypothetical protein n=1 Tax=Thalassolituus oleivorans TaxID=187493 RepID=UPI0023F8935D|nr:hypothetical protein [Thalassolituus oleivorans]
MYWDPIGIGIGFDEDSDLDEYSSYVPRLLALLAKGASLDEVQTYLNTIEMESMGLLGDVAATKEFARWLVETWSS